ncbi:MAG: hypothetical protein HC894_05070 [Microcoleus sp. SM1_3_4]|nr:hypothetical protein [Microcoleus sp. SM1_3_4]
MRVIFGWSLGILYGRSNCMFCVRHRESVGVKFGSSIFSARTQTLYGFDASPPKNDSRNRYNLYRVMVQGKSQQQVLTGRKLKWYFYDRFTELNLKNQIHQGF